ncbi:LLM class flavin-dependent oxidoreductase [Neolewinella antarctica]|uniref:LLM family oxidoreductase n=1 Tax=Neolewinella antarctica TaxID=442734 RepID=A0ABX0X5W6_9BACT|nr:LLM class flavin-dependent oxidoreductase [Neolewinella antarctica]NJC24532.1 putative LLM family oxidoreductase [Neolewinella antarctica]
MQIGIDSFVATQNNQDDATAVANLLDRIVAADEAGLDLFALGEHHRSDFLDSAAHMYLAAAAARTKNILLGSAVTVVSAADPVRVFQNFATLDLISNGRAEIVAGRGSFVESFPLFGYNLSDYQELFKEKLELLLKIRDEEVVTWRGKFRAPLNEQAVYPRPKQQKLPIWLGAGGTPASFVRAGTLGLPLMVAVIGGQTHRFAPLVDSYREAFLRSGHPETEMRVGLHSLGFVAKTSEAAHQGFYPGYKQMFDKIGKERGGAPITEAGYFAQAGPLGALVVGSPEEVAEKIVRHSAALGGIDRFTFQMDMVMNSPDGGGHEGQLEAIRLIGGEVMLLVNQ